MSETTDSKSIELDENAVDALKIHLDYVPTQADRADNMDHWLDRDLNAEDAYRAAEYLVKEIDWMEL